MQRRGFLKYLGLGVAVPAVPAAAVAVSKPKAKKRKFFPVGKTRHKARENIRALDFPSPKPNPKETTGGDTVLLAGGGGMAPILEGPDGYPEWTEPVAVLALSETPDPDISFSTNGTNHISLKDIIRTLQAQEIEIAELQRRAR